ncbi:hypothetical protein ACWDFL_27615 [Streptomyces bungoensis]
MRAAPFVVAPRLRTRPHAAPALPVQLPPGRVALLPALSTVPIPREQGGD